MLSKAGKGKLFHVASGRSKGSESPRNPMAKSPRPPSTSWKGVSKEAQMVCMAYLADGSIPLFHSNHNTLPKPTSTSRCGLTFLVTLSTPKHNKTKRFTKRCYQRQSLLYLIGLAWVPSEQGSNLFTDLSD